MRITKVHRLALLGVAFLVVVGLLIVPLLSVTRFIPENRTYIIGWDVDPPDQLPTDSGEPTGFAVELVRQAAKRRGIRLQWVLHPESSEAALRSKAVDLWPMMVITEDRKQILHLTDPFQENEYGLLVDAKSVFTRIGDLKQRTLSYDGMPFNGRLLREHFPGAVPLRKPSLADAVRSLCIGEAQAVFVEHITAVALLLSGSPCPGTSLRMLPIPTIRTKIGMGATRESSAAADAIREEIGVMADDGSLQKIIGAWSYTSGQELASLVALQHAKSHLWWYRIGFVAVGGLFVVASWSAAGYRRQKMKAQAYSRALGQAERNVRLAADSLSEMVVAYDMHRSLIYANSGAEKLTGCGPAELQLADPLSWTHPEDRSQVLALWDKAFDGHTVDQVVYRVITKDGAVKWTAGSWGPVFDETGHQVGVRVTCLDITERMVAEEALQETTQKFRTIVEEIAERKQAETALRESEERFRAIFSQAAVGIAQTGLDAKWLLLNARFCEILGYTQAELSGKNFLEITHPDDREASLAAVRQLLAGDISSWSTEKRYVRKDGTIVWARVFLSLMRDQANRPQYFIFVVEDVTKRMEAERALRDSERRLALAQSAGHLGEWSYDLRTKAIVASRENFQLYGLPADHARLTYEEWLRLIHPDDRERVKAAVQESIEGTHVCHLP